MAKGEEYPGYQMHFDEKEVETVYRFLEGTVIYPDRSGRGMLRGEISAKKLPYHVNGLTGYRSGCRMDLHHDGRYWSLPEGTDFGAYANKARK
ncbi:hypothetical protein HZC27_00255 [Candidatus Roizmanbacteria bacterium]|nr:hypothetical protein [Candidatus Roizmanbacteria bacterium]